MCRQWTFPQGWITLSLSPNHPLFHADSESQENGFFCGLVAALQGPAWAPFGLSWPLSPCWCLYPLSSSPPAGQMFICNAADKEKASHSHSHGKRNSYHPPSQIFSNDQGQWTTECCSNSLQWTRRQYLWLALCIVVIISNYLRGFKITVGNRKANKGFALPKLPFCSPHSVLKCPFVKFMTVSSLLALPAYFQTNLLFSDFTVQPLWQFSQFCLSYKGSAPGKALHHPSSHQVNCSCVTFPVIKHTFSAVKVLKKSKNLSVFSLKETFASDISK